MKKNKLPVDKQYEYLTQQRRYLDDKIFKSLVLFIQLATAIVGGTFFLKAHQGVAATELMAWVIDGLFCSIALGIIFLISNNLRAWKKHGDDLSERYEDVPDSTKRVWWASEALACFGIAIVVVGFAWVNPIQRLTYGCRTVVSSFAFLIVCWVFWKMPTWLDRR